jgi:hypothetical protein
LRRIGAKIVEIRSVDEVLANGTGEGIVQDQDDNQCSDKSDSWQAIASYKK